MARRAAEDDWLFQPRALRAMRSFEERARNENRGCGGVMRVAPVGLFACRGGKQKPLQDTFHLKAELAALTHGHPTGSVAAAALILTLVDGAGLSEALSVAKSCLHVEREHSEALRALELAETLAASEIAGDDAIARLGQGWVAEEAQALAVYCVLVARDNRHRVILALNHEGDSDSTGTIGCNLRGALDGMKAIPAEWLEPLKMRDVNSELAEDLYQFSHCRTPDMRSSTI